MLRGKAKRSKTRELRIYFATDLHGSEVCFRKFLAAARGYEADVILLGGDFAGKAIVPVLTEDGMLRARVGGEDVTVSEAEWDRLAADIGKSGLYPVRMDAAELARLSDDPEELDRLFRRQISAQMQRWCDLAAERLDPVTPSIRLYLVNVYRALGRMEDMRRENSEYARLKAEQSNWP